MNHRALTLLSAVALAVSAASCGTSHEMADVGPADAPLPDIELCRTCLSATLTWGMDGGLACTRDSSSLAPCGAFTHRRVAEACDPIDRMCTNEVPGCVGAVPTAIVVRNVLDALAHPDVVTALGAAPVLYGTDSRPVDGQVFYVDVDGGRIEVGGCADATCSEIPPGVRALQTVLQTLTIQKLSAGVCADVFGAP